MKRAMIFLVTALAGCASMPERGNETVSTRAERAAAEKLYAGQSPVVHATEFPVASAAEGIARGDMAWRQGKLDLAVYLYVQSLAYDSAMAGPFLKIAAIHEQLGNNALAEKAFELALERDPANAGACERLGLLYLESRQDDAAERLLHAAVRKDPNRWRAYNGLGILADRRAEYGLAEQHYDRAHLLQPNNASVINNRGYSHYLAGKPEAAEADLRYALQLGGPPGTWTNLGKALAKQGRHEEALESLLKEADAAHAYNTLGEVVREGGDLQRARRYFADAISAAPRYFPDARENLTEVDKRLAAAARESGAPAARITPAGANTAVIGQVDPMTVPVGYWLSQGKTRAGGGARRQGAAVASRQASARAGKAQ